MIGTGIFLSVRGVVSEAGSVGASMCVWAVCGILQTVTMTVYTELGTMLPQVNSKICSNKWYLDGFFLVKLIIEEFLTGQKGCIKR